MKYAFRCRSCRHLEEAGAAGERTVPAACHSCGAGVSFDPKTGAKVYDEENWIVLADLPDDELDEVLEYHGIKKSAIERHKPIPAPDALREPASIERATDETLGAKDLTG